MQLWTDLSEVPPRFGPSVVTIGSFDGLHRGHAAVLGCLVALAKESNAKAVAVTFDPHPVAVHRPEAAPVLLTGLTDRLELLARTGVDAVLLVRYTLEFAAQTPPEFVETYLVNGLGARTVVMGRDARFGKGNVGDLATMIELGTQHGFDVVAVDDIGQRPVDQEISGIDSHRWSSTAVRQLLTDGRVDAAAQVLGRWHLVRGVVVHGDARGRTLGFPTANLGDVAGMIPADGVYAGWLVRPELAAASPDDPDVRLPAAISVGTNPTFNGAERRVEAYVLDRTDLDLYDEQVVMEFVEHLRPTIRFDGIDALVTQMHADVDRARGILRA